jgi:hypothetical protein
MLNGVYTMDALVESFLRSGITPVGPERVETAAGTGSGPGGQRKGWISLPGIAVTCGNSACRTLKLVQEDLPTSSTDEIARANAPRANSSSRVLAVNEVTQRPSG